MSCQPECTVCRNRPAIYRIVAVETSGGRIELNPPEYRCRQCDESINDVATRQRLAESLHWQPME